MIAIKQEPPEGRRRKPSARLKRAYRLAGGRELLLGSIKFQVDTEPETKGLAPEQKRAEVRKRLNQILKYYDRQRFGPES